MHAVWHVLWCALISIESDMEAEITEVSLEPCIHSKFVVPFRVNFKQNGRPRKWDCVNTHDSVAVLIFNTTRNAFVLVQQFRPAVYMSRYKHLWEHDKIFDTSLSCGESSDEAGTPPPQKGIYGPGKMGCTYELCAGIVDKKMSLQQIAQEEVIEETGYKVPLESLECVTSFYSSVGHAGSHQTLYYCEVTDDMLEGAGGGVVSDGEMIQVVYLTLEESLKLIFDQEKARSSGLIFALMWFQQYKRPAFKQGL